MTYNNAVWGNITFPVNYGETTEELDYHLKQILSFITSKNPSFDDISDMFETTNWNDFITIYPDHEDWKNTILNAVRNRTKLIHNDPWDKFMDDALFYNIAEENKKRGNV